MEQVRSLDNSIDDSAVAQCDKRIAADSTDIGAYYEKAKTLLALKRKEEAIVAYDKIIANAYLSKGAILEDLNQKEAVVGAYEQVIKLDPNNIDAYYRKANILSSLGKLKEADAAYSEAIRINPTRLEGSFQRGVPLASLDQNEDVLVNFEKVIGEKPDLNKKITCKALHLEAAITVLNQRIKYNPEDVGAYITKGEHLMELGRLKEALEAYHEVVKINPKHKWGYENVGFALYHLGEIEEAIKWYDKQVKIRDEWIIHAKKGKALCDLGNMTEGMEHIQKAMDKLKKGKLQGNHFTAEDGLQTFYNELEVALLREIEALLGQ